MVFIAGLIVPALYMDEVGKMGVFPCGKCGEPWFSFDPDLHTCNSEKVKALELKYAELLKESKFRIELGSLWVSQLRKALGEAMDALASDPNHDVSLQARLEMTRRAVLIETKEIPAKKPTEVPRNWADTHRAGDDEAEHEGDCSVCGWNGDRDEANEDGSPPATWSRSMGQTSGGKPICSHCQK